MNLLPLPLILALSLMPPLAEPNARWTPGFPMSIPGTGSVLISGRARPEAGFTLVASTVQYFEDGDAVTSRSLTVGKTGVLGPAVISGLTPGKQYVVVIQVVQNRGDQTDRIETVSHVTAR